ncbi:hypothetical protein NMG60_11034946 [Bertholletia excelsa]
MSNITGDEGSFSSGNTGEEVQLLPGHKQLKTDLHGSSSEPPTTSNGSTSYPPQPSPPVKKKRNLPGTPDPTAEVIALSPTTLMATNRFVCEICNKGFQRDQNLQLHRRGHNLPWKLKQRTSSEVKKRVYICPEPSCVHHNPARALGDLTGIKKHYSRKHGEKKWKCDKCSKKYAVQSDWKAHQKTCGTREYKCDCGTIFSRRDSFITHRAFCDALAEENNKVGSQQGQILNMHSPNMQAQMPDLISSMTINCDPKNPLKSLPQDFVPLPFKPMTNVTSGMCSASTGPFFGGGPRSASSSSSGLQLSSNASNFSYLHDSKTGSVPMSATALLQKAAQMGATASNSINSPMMQKSFTTSTAGPEQMRPVPPPPYGAPQQHNNPYEDFQPPSDQTTLVGINGGGFSMNEMAQMGMFGWMYVDQNQFGLEKGAEHEDSNSKSLMPPGRPLGGTSRFAGDGDDMTTVDFLGVGGLRPPNLHGQRMELEAINEQRTQLMNAFQHHQLPQGGPAVEKPIWDF